VWERPDPLYIIFSAPGTDPLFLQMKEEPRSAYAFYLPKATVCHSNQAQPVVYGQRTMQQTSDPLLGFTTMDGRHFPVRQLNRLPGPHLLSYADICGELLIRSHGRSGDAALIAGYLGRSDRFDRVILRFFRAYAGKMESDWESFTKSIKGNAHR
jgi:hypothetical protein